MAITTRADKGAALTHAELDTNFTDLRDHPTGITIPNARDVGIKTDTDNPSYPWHDILGHIQTFADDANRATYTTYRGGIHALRFGAGQHAHVNFHIPHDYVMGTAIYIHAHWSHAATNVTGGTVTFGFETMYGKGHNQSSFDAPINISVIDVASTTQYQHMIAETAASTPGGSAVQLDTNAIEPDGIAQVRVYVDSNDLLISGGTVPDIFIHFVDVHYQSTGIGTKQRNPDFWA